MEGHQAAQTLQEIGEKLAAARIAVHRPRNPVQMQILWQ
jgi:hypothetical protein